MKRDYYKLIKDSFNYTMKYKILWFFGFLAALFGGGGSFNIPGGSGSDSSSNETYNNPRFEEFGRRFQEFISSPDFIIFIIITVLFVLLLSVLLWYLNRISQTALILAVRHDSQGDEGSIRLGRLWNEANSHIVNIIKYDLVWLLLALAAVLILLPIFVLPVVVMGPAGGVAVLLLGICLLVPVLLLLSVIVSIIQLGAFRVLILDRAPVIYSIKQGWNLFRNNIKDYILTWLTSLLPACAFFFVSTIIAIIVILPLFLPVYMLSSGTPDQFVPALIILAIMACGAWIFLSLIRAPYVVFYNTYWTKFIIDLHNQDRAARDLQ
jgi:hypothetical protein